MIYYLKLLFQLPKFLMYLSADLNRYIYCKAYNMFYGWGIHLFTGRFGTGKTSTMIALAYKKCVKYKKLSILTNVNIINFPAHTKVYKLNTAQDILSAPRNCLVLIDEIGTIFNSRDFSGGKTAVPKPLYQHLCQCRKRRMMIYATVQRYNLLDKQIRDITATVSTCRAMLAHPFTRLVRVRTYDIDDYDTAMTNPTYRPRPLKKQSYIQSNLYRQLYDTSELISKIEEFKYLDDEQILANRGETQSIFGDKDIAEKIKKRFRG